MEASKLLLLVLVVKLIFVIPKSSAQFEFFYKKCRGTNYSTPSTYQTNLNTALKSMSSDTRITYGYYNFSAGKKPDKVEAMALCRADVSVDECRSCVSSSASTLPSVCPKATQAFAFSQNCLIYFTDTPVFHVLTDGPIFAIWIDGNFTANIQNFSNAFTTLMANLQMKASLGNSEVKFATGMATLNSTTNLYGLVQCSPDLSRPDCVECVQYLVVEYVQKYFDTFTNGTLFVSMGGRAFSPSCNIRYELYPFYKNVTYRPQLPASNRNVTSAQEEEMDTLQFLKFNIGSIKVATENFADDNKVRKGGSGTVYKGILSDGRVIAVKRLEKDAVQGGDLQFKNEILTLAKLHHRNLVRLLGFCLEENEMLLIYEFVVNKSFDNFLFGQ